jgi:hypothetical protein
MKHWANGEVMVITLALAACGGQVVSRQAGGGSSSDGSVDGLSPAEVGETIKLDCMQFCGLVEASFPQCAQLITSPERPVSCATWCEVTDAEATQCGAEALAYYGCVLERGNMQGCVLDASAGEQGGFVFPVCQAAANTAYACVHAL